MPFLDHTGKRYGRLVVTGLDPVRNRDLDSNRSRCWYCSKMPEVRILKNRRKAGDLMFRANGIDRIDSDLGYTFTNSVPCCKTCNFMKNTLSLIEFIEQVDRISRQSDFPQIFQESV